LLSNPERVQAVFFDLGHTLLRFNGEFDAVVERSYHVLAEALVHAGHPLDPATFAERFNQVIGEYYQSREIDLIERPIEDFIKSVTGEFGYSDLPIEVTRSAMSVMYAYSESHWQLDPEAPAVLQQLRKRGMKLGIITNAANAANANRLIDRNDLREHFESILISAEERIRKPDPCIYARALESVQLPASSALMVGDSLVADIAGAQNAGLRAVWVDRGFQTARVQPKRNPITPDATIRSLAELPGLLNS